MPSWCKVSTSLDSHPKIRKAGNLGRQVFEFCLRRNAELDRGGSIPDDHLEPGYLGQLLMVSAKEAEQGVSRCVTAGLLVRDMRNYVITGWDEEWGKRPLTDSERKRNQRARERDSTDVTKCHEVNVTESDSHECHAEREEIRGEERERLTLSVQEEPAGPAEKPQRSAPRRALDPAWTPSRADSILAAESAASARGIDVAFELAQLRDWAIGNGERKADWDATWRGWLRRARPASGNGFKSANAERRNPMRPM